ncbi:MAG TPA: hypothetical protein DCQ68_18500 [Chryseobacterium indologenes]|nr:hypothetical protein [Chryseobacterium indologenes]
MKPDAGSNQAYNYFLTITDNIPTSKKTSSLALPSCSIMHFGRFLVASLNQYYHIRIYVKKQKLTYGN